MGRDNGLDEAKILAVPVHRESPLFSELERRVLDYAEALTRTPTEVTDEHVEALLEHLDRERLVELTACVAWENFRSRFNRGFGVEAQGFSEGACCPVVPPPAASTGTSA